MVIQVSFINVLLQHQLSAPDCHPGTELHIWPSATSTEEDSHQQCQWGVVALTQLLTCLA